MSQHNYSSWIIYTEEPRDSFALKSQSDASPTHPVGPSLSVCEFYFLLFWGFFNHTIICVKAQSHPAFAKNSRCESTALGSTNSFTFACCFNHFTSIIVELSGGSTSTVPSSCHLFYGSFPEIMPLPHSVLFSGLLLKTKTLL